MMEYDFTQPEDIHARQKITPERDWLFVLMLVLVLAIEWFVMSSLLAGKTALALAFHVLAFMLLLTYARMKSYRGKDARFAWIATYALPLMGPLAPAGVLLSLLWYFLSKEKSLSFEEWRDSIFPIEHKSLAQTVYERITYGREQVEPYYNVTYLMDILRMGNDEKKREAIFKISRYYDPGLAPLLRIALEDEHNVIRVLAATATAKLKHGFFERSVELENLREEWPEKNRILYDLARHYDNYAFSGLLEDAQEQENRSYALRYYREFIDREASNDPLVLDARQHYARLLLRMDKVKQACRELEIIREAGGESPGLNLWYGECLFRLKRYDELRKLARKEVESETIRDTVKYPYNIREAMQLWAGKREAGA